jgi:DNA polymerase III subunit alpha, Gram-positive type
MGLSHGKDVWKGNAQELIRAGICTLRDVIGCRDSIMTTLMQYRIESKDAFDIMEKVRKGKGLTDRQEKLMMDAGIPTWYIDSCKKIQYMFPKAHAAAYSISALRIAWFKVYHKTEYYCAYFTVRANEFDGRLMCRGYDHVKHYMEKLRSSYKSKEKIIVRIDGKDEEISSDKAKTLYSILELIEEMYCRGIEFLPISIYESDSVKFLRASEYRIRPPLNALPTVSAAVAANIVNTRKKNPKFLSREDFASRCGIGESLMKLLASQSCLNDLPETTQIDLFSLLA